MGSVTALLNLLTATMTGSFDLAIVIANNGSFNGNHIGDDVTVVNPPTGGD